MSRGSTKISEGLSLAYLIHSILLTAGLVVFGLFHIWPLFLIPVVLTLLLFKTGVEVDGENRRVRKYIGWLGHRWGIWLPLDHFQGVVLEEFVVSKPNDSWFRYARSSARTYDILLLDRFGKAHELNDFFEYDLALRCFTAIANEGLEPENKYAEYTRKLMAKRRR